MRRKLGALAGLVCLCAAGAAYAAGPVTGGPNTYTGGFVVAGGAGTAVKPVPVALTEILGMGSATSGNVGAPLVEIKTRTYGVKAPNAKYFPTCSVGQIGNNNGNNNGNNGKWNSVCPKGSLIATGTVQAALTSPASNLAGPGTPCSLDLWVYNAGGGKLTYFFTVPATATGCGGLATGAAAPWTGTASQSGKYLVTTTPEPPDVSYNAGNVGLFGSLETETLHFRKVSVKHAGKLYPFIESFGCSHHTRPFTITYTATTSNTPSSANESSGTVTGAAGC